MQTFRLQADGDQRAVRTDAETGVREVAEFFGPDRLRMFGCSHFPPGGAVGGLVVCSPIYAEFQRNYRREVILGRHLASVGLAVQRFHYRGTGNSDGETSSLTYETMVEDVIASADWLKRAAGLDRVAFLGTRWGALVAAEAARSEGAPLALWEPVLDATRYFRELFRALRIHELKEGETELRPSETHDEQIRRQGWLDVLGYSVHRSLLESANGRTLEAGLGRERRPLLLVHISQSERLPNDYAMFASRREQLGFAMDTRIVPWAEEVWWFQGGRAYEEEPAMAAELAQVTGDWILKTLLRGAPSV